MKEKLANLIKELEENKISDNDIADLYKLLQTDDVRINYDEVFRDFYADSKNK